MSGIIWPGTMDSYFAMCNYKNAVARRQRADRERAETDPTMQCEHRVSLYRGCQSCQEPEPSSCAHSWVSGMMYVHHEDLHATAVMRAASGSSLPECEHCELVYDPENPPALDD
jgi:hypothetical protein